MNKKILLLLIVALINLTGCEKKSDIEGLWVVKMVKVGDQEMTPNARWMRFNADHTQQSGNGWLQHSHGTWTLDPNTHELSIINTNGVVDPNEPFKVSFGENGMLWKRIEEGEAVEIRLEKSDQLPETWGDRLLGLWKLEEAMGTGMYFDPMDKADTGAYIFFRWDRRFVIHSDKKRINGVYNVHGHKPEVELIPYGDRWARDFWKIEFDRDTIILQLLNTDSVVIRKFRRIHDFPKEN